MLRSSDLVDVGLAVAAQHLVEQSLGIVPTEKVLVVYDAAHEGIVAIVSQAIRTARGEPSPMRLEDLGARPHASLHPHCWCRRIDVD